MVNKGTTIITAALAIVGASLIFWSKLFIIIVPSLYLGWRLHKYIKNKGQPS